MVSSITKLVLIGGGLAIAAGLAYFTYQYTTSNTLGGQLARSRLGLDEPPPLTSLANREADPSKPLSQQPKDPLREMVDELIQNFSKVKNPTPPPGGYFVLPQLQVPTSNVADAAYYYNMRAEEEKYEPWALQR